MRPLFHGGLIVVLVVGHSSMTPARGQALRRRENQPAAVANAPTTLELQESLDDVQKRLEQSEKTIEQLRADLERMKAAPSTTVPADFDVSQDQINKAVDAVLAKYETLHVVQEGSQEPQYDAGYDRGFFIRPAPGTEGIPWDIRINGRMQFRYTGFKSDDENFIKDRNDFEIERGRLMFRGHFIDPRLSYFINLDADTDDDHDVKFHDFWMTWEHSEAVNITFGKRKVPGSRHWLLSSQRTRFSDRDTATTFFRPDRTIGVWLHGTPVENTYYELMVGNGFATSDITPNQIDDQFAFSGTFYWDPLGDFGNDYSDLECHTTPVVRVGHSLTFADMDPTTLPGEQLAFRLVDSGTRLVTAFPGAAQGFDVWTYSVDAAFKYLGFSMNAEWFMRWLQDFETSLLPTPSNDLFDYGFFVEGGYFIIPKQVEVIGRIARINSDGGSPSSDEYAAGVNYFVKGHDLKLTFDVSVLNGSPAQNSGPNYVAGQDGVMYRTQLEAAF